MSNINRAPLVVKFLLAVYILGILFRLGAFFPGEEGFTTDSYWRIGELIVNAIVVFCIFQRFPFTWKLGLADAALTLRSFFILLFTFAETKAQVSEVARSSGSELSPDAAELMIHFALYGAMAMSVVSAAVYVFLWLKAKPYFFD